MIVSAAKAEALWRLLRLCFLGYDVDNGCKSFYLRKLGSLFQEAFR